MCPISLKSGIIYGPIQSRRLGSSLGLNVSPLSCKLCSFDCVYCQYGWTAVHTFNVSDRLSDFPSPDEFTQALETALRSNVVINNVTFSGNGEPTLHPQFEELVDIARQLKDRYRPESRLGILSNSSTASLKVVARALNKLDFRILKLDAGNEEVFQKLNRPCPGVYYETIVLGLKSLTNVILQTMFIDGEIQNSSETEIEGWMKKISEIKPLKVQIYSLHRPSADSSLSIVPPKRLREIAKLTEDITGVPIVVF
jgi:wyosine [tRNA(Phe)-imidazoG37] synthetase (radical SAM superfamily)